MLDNNFSRLYCAVCLQQHKTRPLSIHRAVLVAPHVLGFGWGFWDDGSSYVSWFLRSFSRVSLAGIPSEMITSLKPINVCGMSSWCRKLKWCRYYYRCNIWGWTSSGKVEMCGFVSKLPVISLNPSLILLYFTPTILFVVMLWRAELCWKCLDLANTCAALKYIGSFPQLCLSSKYRARFNCNQTLGGYLPPPK